MLRVGVVGCGYWGPNIIRNFQSLDGCEVRSVFDFDRARVEQVRKINPVIQGAASFDEMLEEAYGRKAADALLASWRNVVKRSENHLNQARPDLSYTPEP